MKRMIWIWMWFDGYHSPSTRPCIPVATNTDIRIYNHIRTDMLRYRCDNLVALDPIRMLVLLQAMILSWNIEEEEERKIEKNLMMERDNIFFVGERIFLSCWFVWFPLFLLINHNQTKVQSENFHLKQIWPNKLLSNAMHIQKRSVHR